MHPIVEGGQAGYFAPGMQYSEGAVTIMSGGEMVGRGFAESVGYVTTPDAIMSIAGLAVDDENLAAMSDPHVGVGHKALKQWGPSL